MTQKICPSISVTLLAQLTPPVAMHLDAGRNVFDPLLMIRLRKSLSHSEQDPSTSEQETTMEHAHSLARKFFTFASWCLVNKACNTAFSKGKEYVGPLIATLLENVRQANADYFQKTLSDGKYIDVFKIYYFYQPNALSAGSESKKLMEKAITIADRTSSPSLIYFLLKMNIPRGLRLFESVPDSEIVNNSIPPLQNVCRSFYSKRSLQNRILRRILTSDPLARKAIKGDQLIRISDSCIRQLTLDMGGSRALSSNDSSIIQESIQLLQAYGADINQRDSSSCGNALLHMTAVDYVSVNPFAVLLRCGANPNLRNKSGQTPLDICLARGKIPGSQEKIKLLFQYGAEITCDLLYLFDPTNDILPSAIEEEIRKIYRDRGELIPWTVTDINGSNYLHGLVSGMDPSVGRISRFLSWMYENHQEDLKTLLQSRNSSGLTPYLFMLRLGERRKDEQDLLRTYMQKLNIPLPPPPSPPVPPPRSREPAPVLPPPNPVPPQPALPPPPKSNSGIKIILLCLATLLTLLGIKRLYTMVRDIKAGM